MNITKIEGRHQKKESQRCTQATAGVEEHPFSSDSNGKKTNIFNLIIKLTE